MGHYVLIQAGARRGRRLLPLPDGGLEEMAVGPIYLDTNRGVLLLGGSLGLVVEVLQLYEGLKLDRGEIPADLFHRLLLFRRRRVVYGELLQTLLRDGAPLISSRRWSHALI